jgi:hypothetical protein
LSPVSRAPVGRAAVPDSRSAPARPRTALLTVPATCPPTRRFRPGARSPRASRAPVPRPRLSLARSGTVLPPVLASCSSGRLWSVVDRCPERCSAGQVSHPGPACPHPESPLVLACFSAQHVTLVRRSSAGRVPVREPGLALAHPSAASPLSLATGLPGPRSVFGGRLRVVGPWATLGWLRNSSRLMEAALHVPGRRPACVGRTAQQG